MNNIFPEGISSQQLYKVIYGENVILPARMKKRFLVNKYPSEWGIDLYDGDKYEASLPVGSPTKEEAERLILTDRFMDKYGHLIED